MNEQAPKNFEELAVILDALIAHTRKRADDFHAELNPNCYIEQRAYGCYRNIKNLIAHALAQRKDHD